VKEDTSRQTEPDTESHSIDPTTEKLKELSLERPRLRPPRTLETTLFDRLERLHGPGIKRVLVTQYRMNEHIAAFPSKTLYESKLLSDPSVAKQTLLDLPSITEPGSEGAVETLEPTAVFFDTAGCEFYERTEGEDEMQKGFGEGSKSNENEAVVVDKWVRKLVSRD
jgi:DNA polymerase alpha-associated DNA helicase A